MSGRPPTSSHRVLESRYAHGRGSTSGKGLGKGHAMKRHRLVPIHGEHKRKLVFADTIREQQNHKR